MEQVILWKARDGSVFDNEDDCIEYETKILLNDLPHVQFFDEDYNEITNVSDINIILDNTYCFYVDDESEAAILSSIINDFFEYSSDYNLFKEFGKQFPNGNDGYCLGYYVWDDIRLGWCPFIEKYKDFFIMANRLNIDLQSCVNFVGSYSLNESFN